MTALTDAREIEALLDYASTADIAGDPLVIDLSQTLAAAMIRIDELEAERSLV